MDLEKTKGVVHHGKVLIAFPVQQGLGMYTYNGALFFIRFDCQRETCPPQGDGESAFPDSGAALFATPEGKLFYQGSGEPVHIGEVINPTA